MSNIRKIKKYGWIPDLPDQRDKKYSVTITTPLPPKIDLRSQCPAVYNQGQLGSCTANAIAAAIEFNEMKQKIHLAFTPSRLFIYYNERVMEGSVNEDAGAMIRDGIKSVVKLGAPPEKLWPYTDKGTAFIKKPTPEAYIEAEKHQVVRYRSIPKILSQMKTCLAQGFPFVFGFTVYESLESANVTKTGIIPMPGPNESAIGGHAVLAVGYDDSKQVFIGRNSWGPNWGMKGYFTIPYNYLIGELAEDFWTINSVE